MKESIFICIKEYEKIYNQTHPMLNQILILIEETKPVTSLVEQEPELETRTNTETTSAENVVPLESETPEIYVPDLETEIVEKTAESPKEEIPVIQQTTTTKTESNDDVDPLPSVEMTPKKSVDTNILCAPELKTDDIQEVILTPTKIPQTISENEKIARKLINDLQTDAEESDLGSILQSAKEDQKQINEMALQTEIEIRKIRETHEQLMKKERKQLLMSQRKNRNIRKMKQEERNNKEKMLSKEKKHSLKKSPYRTRSPLKIVSPISPTSRFSSPRSPASVRHLRTARKRSQKSKVFQAREFREFPEWSEDVRRLFNVTYKKPLLRIFKKYKGKKPRAQKPKSFDELHLAKSCLSTADFLHIFEEFDIVPKLLNKGDLMHICKEVGQAGGTLVDSQQFLVALWFVSYKSFVAIPEPVEKQKH
eukprot:UN25627